MSTPAQINGFKFGGTPHKATAKTPSVSALLNGANQSAGLRAKLFESALGNLEDYGQDQRTGALAQLIGDGEFKDHTSAEAQQLAALASGGQSTNEAFANLLGGVVKDIEVQQAIKEANADREDKQVHDFSKMAQQFKNSIGLQNNSAGHTRSNMRLSDSLSRGRMRYGKALGGGGSGKGSQAAIELAARGQIFSIKERQKLDPTDPNYLTSKQAAHAINIATAKIKSPKKLIQDANAMLKGHYGSSNEANPYSTFTKKQLGSMPAFIEQVVGQGGKAWSEGNKWKYIDDSGKLRTYNSNN